MSASAEFPAIVAEERPFTGPEHLAEVSALAVLWRGTETRLKELARDPQFLLAVGAGDPDLIATHSQRIIRETQRELGMLRARTDQWANRTVLGRFDAGFRASVAEWERQGAEAALVPDYEASVVRATESLVDDVMIDVEFSASSSEQTMRRYLRRTQQRAITEEAVERTLAISDARLENLDQRTKRLALEFEGAVQDGKFINIRGRRFGIENYARVVARTRLAESAAQGAFHAILALGGGYVQISDHGPTDPACDRHAGKVYSISGGDSRFPRLRALPPFHPNCQHVVLPYIPELRAVDEIRFAMARSRDRIGPGVTLQQFLRG